MKQKLNTEMNVKQFQHSWISQLSMLQLLQNHHHMEIRRVTQQSARSLEFALKFQLLLIIIKVFKSNSAPVLRHHANAL